MEEPTKDVGDREDETDVKPCKRAESGGSEEGAKVLEPTTDVGEPAESPGDGSEARVREPAIDVGDASSMLSTGTSEKEEWSREAWQARGVVARTGSLTRDGG